jgi:hypothetical protein
LMRDTGRWVKKINEISARRRYFYCFSDSAAMPGIMRREKNAVIRAVIRPLIRKITRSGARVFTSWIVTKKVNSPVHFRLVYGGVGASGSSSVRTRC